MDKHGLWISMAKDKRHQAATSAKQVRWAAEVKRRPQRAAIAFLRDAREQTELDQCEVIMNTCFFCNKAIENENDYILIGLVQDEAAELVPAHQDCASLRSDHVELFGLLESPPPGMASS